MAASRESGGTGDMLPAERARATFDVNQLMALMGTDKKLQLVQNSRKLFEGTPFGQAKGTEPMDPYRSYADVFEAQLERTAAAISVVRDNAKFRMAHQAGRVQMADMFEANGVAAIHFTMFLTFLKTNASKEQQKAWLEGAQEASYLGAYAQTELGHGSNVRGLETIATFDKETDEFVIHSPTLTSLKWWPTGMYACTHGVVFATMIIDGKNCGVQGFFVQFRDADGNLMPGVEVGEIGPKIAEHNTNIGYGRFNHVRVPRFNLFSKLYQVTRDGKFIAPPPKEGKIKNISMMMMRVFNVRWAARDTSKAAVIAARYSLVRKQGFKDTVSADGGGLGENTIMDYRMQQYRVLKALSLSYMLFWGSESLDRYLMGVQRKITMNDPDAAEELPELHATCSGLKVWATVRGHGQIEECRKACGGQGFLRSSGLADLVSSLAEPVTVEGEQVILSLQVARFLIKSVKEVKAKKAPKGSVKYLLEEPLAASRFEGLSTWAGKTALLMDLMRERTRAFAFELEERFAKAEARGLSFDEATNSVAIFSYKAAGCHAAYVMASHNNTAIEELVDDVATKAVLLRLLDLQLLTQVYEEAADWIGILGRAHVGLLFDRINELLDELRPDVVALTDAFGYDDYNLKSTIGRHDGNVYEAIYEDAKMSPLNQSDRMVGWDKLAPVLDLDFIRQGIGQRADGGPASKL